MSEVRSAAAMAGHVDVELLIFETARALSAVKTEEDLEREWKARVPPVYDQLSPNALSILSNIHGLNLTIIMQGLRK